MWVKFGADDVLRVQVGETNVKRVYHGSEQIIPYPTVDTADVVATDFGGYFLGEDPPDWAMIGGASAEITKNGVISPNCLDVTAGALTNYAGALWTVRPPYATDDVEVLGLVEHVAANNTDDAGTSRYYSGVLSKASSVDDLIGATLGRTDAEVLQHRRLAIKGGVVVAGAAGFTWNVATRYWVRLRSQSGRVQRRKTWVEGGTEPGSFSDFTVGEEGWPTAAGYPGVHVGYEPGRTTRCHWLAVAYAGETAPFPS